MAICVIQDIEPKQETWAKVPKHLRAWLWKTYRKHIRSRLAARLDWDTGSKWE
jgi:hypothetical protein